MISLLFIPAILCYSLSAYISNHSEFQATQYYYGVGLILSLLANTIWLTIAKYTLDPHTRYLYALCWDVISILAYLIIPVLIFNIPIRNNVILGIIFILIGMIIAKV